MQDYAQGMRSEECKHGIIRHSCALCTAPQSVPQKLELGEWYKRSVVQKGMGLGVEPQIYLPSRDGRITSGWFVLEINPDAPREVLPERKGIIPDRARQLVAESGWIPVFIKEKRDHDHYQFVGHYRGTELWTETDHAVEVAQRQRRVRDRQIIGILFSRGAPWTTKNFRKRKTS